MKSSMGPLVSLYPSAGSSDRRAGHSDGPIPRVAMRVFDEISQLPARYGSGRQ